MRVCTKRIYEPYAAEDGLRILVDRLWPRGIKKDEAHIDKWFKDVAPSNELRKWYNHEREKFEIFSRKYRSELGKTTALDELLEYINHHELVTLLFAAKDEDFNNAVVLKKIITNHLK